VKEKGKNKHIEMAGEQKRNAKKQKNEELIYEKREGMVPKSKKNPKGESLRRRKSKSEELAGALKELTADPRASLPPLRGIGKVGEIEEGRDT